MIKKESDSPSTRPTNWLIPLVAFQLEDFHPACGDSNDVDRFEKLMTLYLAIRKVDVRGIRNGSIPTQLSWIRSDFYRLVQNESNLPYMIFTMDDGPLTGEVRKSVPKVESQNTIRTLFGKLTVGKANGKLVVIAANRNNKIMWSRLLRGTNPARYLKNANLSQVEVQNTSLATVVSFYADGERLTLYTKPSGEFLFYYHSW
ncbi:MAG TPA: hypothetical protein VK468_10160 [Pyrinomonadaceae bacterium]|nr:hypothetical protein [Pyrinomonadaceae bacterium]